MAIKSKWLYCLFNRVECMALCGCCAWSSICLRCYDPQCDAHSHNCAEDTEEPQPHHKNGCDKSVRHKIQFKLQHPQLVSVCSRQWTHLFSARQRNGKLHVGSNSEWWLSLVFFFILSVFCVREMMRIDSDPSVWSSQSGCRTRRELLTMIALCCDTPHNSQTQIIIFLQRKIDFFSYLHRPK